MSHGYDTTESDAEWKYEEYKLITQYFDFIVLLGIL